ncbi:pilus assembly protein [Klebsiella grimontii]
MKKAISFLALLACLFSFPAWAVDCYQNTYGGPVSATLTLPPFTIPNDIQLGKKIWESSDINITVYCDKASEWSPSNPTENIYAWIKLSAFNSGDVLNNPYFTFGVTYAGVDYEGINQGINTGACLDRIDQAPIPNVYHDPVCNGSSLQKNITFNARFRLYVKIAAIPPDSSTVYNFGDINVLQFDGQGGANLLSDANNLRYYISGLDNIHILTCSASVKLYPENQTVDFGAIYNYEKNMPVLKKNFSLSTIRDQTAGCTERFDITTSFYINENLYDSTHLDIGNGLLLNIVDDTANTDVLFNQYMPFTTYIPGEPSTVTHNYTAELTKKPSESVADGPFSKDVIIKINYQ